MTEVSAGLSPIERQFALFAQLHDELPAPRPREDYPGVTSYYDLTFAELVGFRPLVLDLHIPSGTGPHPVVLWVHGGGWQSGSRAMGHAVELAQHGFAVAAPQYRLSGEARYPAQVHDLRGALRWLRANSQTYHLDASHIAGWGASAGGFLVSMVALTDDEGDVGGNLDQSSRLQAVVAYFMPSDLVALASPSGEAPPDQMATSFLGYKVRERPEAARQSTPIAHVRRDAPPFLILHGDADPLVPLSQSQAFHAALSATGAQSSLVVLPGAIHEDPAFWSNQTLTQVSQFLNRTLGPGG
jgi:acetyl esterase/lipase